jgi:hypothetical protein
MSLFSIFNPLNVVKVVFQPILQPIIQPLENIFHPASSPCAPVNPYQMQQQFNALNQGNMCQGQGATASGQMDLKTAGETLRTYINQHPISLISKDSMKAMLASDKVPADVKAAINAILNTPGAFEKFDSANQSDGKISLGDLNTALSPGWRG